MDVLADSNIYLADLKMAGNEFSELFVYLRRTGSHLLLPHLVLEEVGWKYSGFLRDAARKARSAHESLWKLPLSGSREFQPPDFEHEAELLRKRMCLPSNGVKVVEIDDYSSVQIKDVVSRGIQRRRPASAKGEELRDVVLWLLALHLAKTRPSGVAFISDDKKGYVAEEGGLHPDLLEEVQSLKVPLYFYGSLREFVVAKSLEHHAIDASYFYSLVTRKRIEELITQSMLHSLTRVGTIITVDLRELELEHATSYKVAQTSHFIEALFHGSAAVSIEEFTSYYYDEPLTRFETITQTSTIPGKIPATTEAKSIQITPALMGGILPWSNQVNVTVYQTPKPRKYLCSFRASLTVRVLDGTVESVEAQSVQFVSFLQDERPGG